MQRHHALFHCTACAERVLPSELWTMSSRGRRVFGDALVSTGVLAAVLGVLVSTDIRVREQLQTAARSASSAGVADAGERVRAIGSALIEAAHTQSLEHAPLMVFVVIATVLLLALARS